MKILYKSSEKMTLRLSTKTIDLYGDNIWGDKLYE